MFGHSVRVGFLFSQYCFSTIGVERVKVVREPEAREAERTVRTNLWNRKEERDFSSFTFQWTGNFTGASVRHNKISRPRPSRLRPNPRHRPPGPEGRRRHQPPRRRRRCSGRA